MSRARELSRVGNENTFAVDSDNNEVGIASAVPSSTLDVRGEVKIGTAIQAGVAGVLTATSFSGSGANLTGLATTETVRTDTITVAGVSTFTGAINADATTDSTSVSTGALIVDGGVGIAKNVYIGAGLSVAGTLTYEDVTNVDSVGLITAKSGVNVSGGQVTIGTGITMGIAGIVTSQGFRLADNKQIKFGTGDDSGMYYTGSHLYIDNNTAGDAYLRSTNINLQVNSASSSENALVATANEGVSLYHNAIKTFETIGTGITIYGPEGGNGQVLISADEGDDNADKFNLLVNTTGSFFLQNYASGSWANNLRAYGGGSVELMYGDGTKKFETTNDGTVTTGIATATGGLAINADSKNLTIGASEDLKLFHDGSHSVIHEDGTGGLKFVSANSFQFRDTDKDTGDYLINANIDGAVSLYYNGNSKFETTNDGTVTTGIATVTQGLNTDGLLSEKFNTTAGKLSANTNIDLEDGMVHYFSTQETTTSTPNIRYSSSKTLNNMLSIGDAITVTIITTAAAAGYSAQMNIDGSGQTEEWVGGEAPSAGGSDGLDIYTYNILKTSNATFKVIGNYVNATN